MSTEPSQSSSQYPQLPDVTGIDVAELQRRLITGDTTSSLLTEAYLKRIRDLDQAGPMLRSVIEINPDAAAIACRMDEERNNGLLRGPLHGIPILVKDNIETAGDMMTTAGSLALDGYRSERDAAVVTRLRDAGAVILGKTNLSEWANFRSMRAASGWSSRGGQTKNPYVLDRNPSGSSSGSACAVAASLCAIAVGTETNGSIVAPSSVCAIVGIKPTAGLLDQEGIVPVSHTYDTAGPMARTVSDAATLLSGLTRAEGIAWRTDYSAYLDTSSLKGRRIGIERTFLKGHEDVVALYRRAIEALQERGAEIVPVELVDEIQKLNDAAYTVYKYEFKFGIDRWLGRANARVRTLAELVAFNRSNREAVMPYFKQDLFEECLSLDGLESSEYLHARKKALSSKEMIETLMHTQRLDAIAGTTFGLPDIVDPVLGDRDTGFYFGLPAAVSGYPHITVPMGTVSDLPIGISFMGKPFSEGPLVAIAYAYEQASLHRSAPLFLGTVGQAASI